MVPSSGASARLATIEAAITAMARYQLGREIPSDDVASIKAFLATLAGVAKGTAQ